MSLLPSVESIRSVPGLDDLHALLAQAGMGPGWNKPEPSLWPAPRKNFLPAHWRYELSRAALDAAGRFVSTELAERRNLILFNPVAGNNYATVRTLVCAYQLVLAQETARSHRHTPNALRLVIDAKPGVFTVVDGKKIPMLPGDVLLTPNWAWHGHANESQDCAVWIDFLDVPTLQFFEAMFFERHSDWVEEGAAVDAGSSLRFSFADSMAALDRAPQSQAGSLVVSLGPPQMKTIGLQVERLEAGADIKRPRTTANSIYAVIDGQGETVIDGASFRWSRGDVIAVPSWRPCLHRVAERSHLLRVSDEPMLSMLDWLRVEA
jgi:gentisate 1,2-dioxygenase